MVNIRFTFGISAALTRVGWASPFLRCLDFFVRMWFLYACFLFIFPDAVTWNLFFAPELTFIFGIVVLF